MPGLQNKAAYSWLFPEVHIRYREHWNMIFFFFPLPFFLNLKVNPNVLILDMYFTLCLIKTIQYLALVRIIVTFYYIFMI